MSKVVVAVASAVAAAFSTGVVYDSLAPSTAGHPRAETVQKPLEKIAFGSCSDQSRPQPLWANIAAFQPELWIWMGDNIYADNKEFGQPREWQPSKMFQPATSDTLRSRYGKLLANPEYDAFANSTPVIGIWDDHDFGINDGDKHYFNREESQQIFLDFLNEPADSPRRKQEGIYTSYTLGTGDQTVKFILLDNRYNRDPYNTKDGDFLGETQWEWLKNELLTTTAAFNVIVSGIQILPTDRFAVAECWNRFPNQRERLLKLILSSHAKGVILLSGDVHFSEINQIICSNGTNILTEITSSGMTHSWMQFALQSWVKYIFSLMFTYGNLVLPWEFRPEQEAFYGSLNWGSIQFDWNRTPHPVATVQVRGLDNHVKLEHKFESTPVYSDTAEDDSVGCKPPRELEPWQRMFWEGTFIIGALAFLLSIPFNVFVAVWIIWFVLKKVIGFLFRRTLKEKTS